MFNHLVVEHPKSMIDLERRGKVNESCSKPNSNHLSKAFSELDRIVKGVLFKYISLLNFLQFNVDPL